MFDLLPDGIAIYDNRNRLRKLNASFMEYFGLVDESELVNKPHSEVGKRLNALQKAPDESPTAHNPTDQQCCFELKNGRWLESYRQSHSHGYLVAYRDVTEWQQLRIRRGHLQKHNRQLSQTLNMVSHDLRIPLTAIIGYAEFLKNGIAGKLGETQDDYVEQILTSADFLERIVRMLLDLSRLETGNLNLNYTQVNYGSLIERTAANLNIISQRKGIRLITLIDPALPTVSLDNSRIRQVLDNLLSNAFKFTPTGGRIELRAFKRENCIITEVKDTGIGISPENLPRLFEKFYQVPSGECRPEGTGLGLAIAKQLVEAHGGQIEASSTLGVGSIFRFSLPLQGQNTTIA